MPYPLRSTVGAAVLAGALVFSGTAANAQPVPADESAASAPAGQGTADSGESAPVLDAGVAPLPPVDDAGQSAGSAAPGEPGKPDGQGEPGGPGTETPGGDQAAGPAGAEDPRAAEDLPLGAEVGAEDSKESPEEIPAETPLETPVEALPPAGESAPPAEAPATPPATGGVSRPASAVVPASGSTAGTAGTKEKATAQPAATLPGSDQIVFPEGSSGWTEDQWNKWMDGEESGQWLEDITGSLVELIDSEEFAGFRDSIFPYFVEGNPESLFAYLEATYPDDLPMAQLLVGVVMGQLMEEGLLDENGDFIGALVPETGEPSEKPDEEQDEKPGNESDEEQGEEPGEESDEEPVIEPVVNTSKPKASTTKPVEVFTPVKVPAAELAETGAEGIGLLAGTGGGLLVLGVGALVLRRRTRA